MPDWLEVILGIAGGLNVVGLVVWIVATIYDLKASVLMLAERVSQITTNCGIRKAETTAAASDLRTETAAIADRLRKQLDDTMTHVFQALTLLQKTTSALAAKAGIHPADYE